MIKAIMTYKVDGDTSNTTHSMEVHIDEESTETAFKQAQKALGALNDAYSRTLVGVELAPVETEEEYAEDDIPDYDLDICDGELEVLTEEEYAQRQQDLDDLYYSGGGADSN